VDRNGSRGLGSFFAGFEVERDGIDAVALASWFGTVVEDMPEM
jgi:hypothetical protein